MVARGLRSSTRNSPCEPGALRTPDPWATAGMTRVYGTRRLPGDGRSALGKERARQHLFHRKGTSPREYLVGQSGLCDRSCTSDRMGVSEHRRHIWSRTGRLAEDSFDLKSLLV